MAEAELTTRQWWASLPASEQSALLTIPKKKWGPACARQLCGPCCALVARECEALKVSTPAAARWGVNAEAGVALLAAGTLAEGSCPLEAVAGARAVVAADSSSACGAPGAGPWAARRGKNGSCSLHRSRPAASTLHAYYHALPAEQQLAALEMEVGAFATALSDYLCARMMCRGARLGPRLPAPGARAAQGRRCRVFNTLVCARERQGDGAAARRQTV